MIAYTAWDSLHVIAREFDADLAVIAGDRVELAPHRRGSAASATVQRLAERFRAGIAVLLITAGLLVS